MAFYVPIGCVRFATYCGKMNSHYHFPYGGLRCTCLQVQLVFFFFFFDKINVVKGDYENS